MQSWQTLIDTASKLCGSQNELARRLDCQSGQLSQVRRGKTTISQQKLAVLAEILGVDPHELWEAQEVANIPRRNPFPRRAGTVAVALIAVILSTLWPADSSMAARLSARSALDHGLYIVAHLRTLVTRCVQAARRAGRYLMASRLPLAMTS